MFSLCNLSAPRADMICQGKYPWAQSAGGGEAAAGGMRATRDQLITQLRMHTSEMERAKEELRRVEDERGRCLSYWARERAALAAALQRTRARQVALEQRDMGVPLCSSKGSSQPHNQGERLQEQMYTKGLVLLLQAREAKASMQLEAAERAFGGNSASSPPGSGDTDSDSESDTVDEAQ